MPMRKRTQRRYPPIVVPPLEADRPELDPFDPFDPFDPWPLEDVPRVHRLAGETEEARERRFLAETEAYLSALMEGIGSGAPLGLNEGPPPAGVRGPAKRPLPVQAFVR
jgi:hypothetical protein